MEDNLLLLDSQEESFVKKLLPIDSQEFDDIHEKGFSSGEYRLSFPDDIMKRELSAPLSPPNTPETEWAARSYMLPVELDFRAKAGRYNFQLEFTEEKKFPSKSCPYTYSKQLHKLFAQKNVDVPIIFKTSIGFPELFEIRSYIVYDDESYRSHPVEKCPTDAAEFEGKNEKLHLIMNSKPGTEYVRCPSGHLVTITYNHRLQADKKSFTDAYRFGCYTTCRGGINRRNISLIFALYANDRCYGQTKISLVICSSPGRDRKNLEKKSIGIKAEAMLPGSSTTTVATRKRKSTTNTTDDNRPPPADDTKKFHVCEFNTPYEDDNKIYYLPIRGRAKFAQFYNMYKVSEDGENYYRHVHGLPPLSPLPDQNGFILSNAGMMPTRKHDFFKNQNAQYEENYKIFNKLKSHFNIRSFHLERSQSDTNGRRSNAERFPIKHERFVFPQLK